MYVYKCEIVKVIDGDTLDVLIDLGFNISVKERVRLLGVDTPEVFGQNAVNAGKDASEFTKLWVDIGQHTKGHFELHSKKYNAREKYGRCLGTIKFVSESGQIKDLVQDLLDAGHIKV